MNLADHNHCSGCSACYATCPRKAIRMHSDSEGFLFPEVDTILCIDCGLCTKVCPVLNQPNIRQPLRCFAVKSNDSQERKASSSGGVFSLLAKRVIQDGGIVFGAAWADNCSKVVHIGIDSVEDLPRLRESKYVQSEIGETYKSCEKFLKSSKLVLFTGCPCQIAGLLSFLGRDYDNLITQEVICNSVPSPKALAAWTEAEKKKVPDEDLQTIHFRDKCVGWHNTTLKYQFTTTTTTSLQLSAYYKLWQRGFTVRRSCIECKFRDFRSGADLTIGDFWGIEKVLPEMDDNGGVSAVLENTPKGCDFGARIMDCVECREVEFSDIAQSNPCLHKSFDLLRSAGDKRNLFWKLVNGGSDLQKLGIKMTQESSLRKIRLAIGRLLRALGVKK